MLFLTDSQNWQKAPVPESLIKKVAVCRVIKQTSTQVFSGVFLKIFKDTYFEELLQMVVNN